MKEEPKFVVRNNGLFSFGVLASPSNLDEDDFLDLHHYTIVSKLDRLDLELVGSIPMDSRIFEERLTVGEKMRLVDFIIRAEMVYEIYSDFAADVLAFARETGEPYFGLDVKVTGGPHTTKFEQQERETSHRLSREELSKIKVLRAYELAREKLAFLADPDFEFRSYVLSPTAELYVPRT